MTAKPVFVAGATGFVGRAFCDALRAQGVPHRRGSRRPASAGSPKAQAGAPAEAPWVRFDLDAPETLAPAMEGCGALVFLVHLMGDGEGYAERERASAFAVREAAAAAGLERVIFLGGVAPSGAPSEHLQSRLVTGQVLRGGAVPCLELRAGMVIGAESESWRICRDLAMRLPVMLLPRWAESRSQPVAIDDVVAALLASLETPLPASEVLGLPGPEVLTARDILLRIAALRGRVPFTLGVPLLSPGLSSHWLRLVTDANPAIAMPLVHGLKHDMIDAGPSMWARMEGHERVGFDEAARRAMAGEASLGRLKRLVERGAGWLSRAPR